MGSENTRIIRLTPPGKSALATLQLRGKDALEKLFRFVETDSENLSSDRPHFGRFSLENAKEELVFHILDEQRIELHTHGGEAVIRSVEKALQSQGVQKVSWIDDIRSKIQDLRQNPAGSELAMIRNEALEFLSYAKTETTAKILLDQYHGALIRELEEIRTLSRERAGEEIRRLLENAALGPFCVKPFRVVLFGSVNAGKSSLINAMLGFERVIVDSLPGTTRDCVAVESAIKGWSVTFFDTAGLRDTDHALERLGIEKTRDILDRADLLLHIVDPGAPHWIREWEKESEILAETGRKDRIPPLITVLNKWDIPEVRSRVSEISLSDFPPLASAVRISAEQGPPLEELLQRIIETLVPRPPEPGEAVPLNERQRNLVQFFTL